MNYYFRIASTEIIEILKYTPNEYKVKIPKKLINFFEKMSISNYKVNIDPNKSLYNQDISEKTKDIVAILYNKYWCDEKEKNELNANLLENENKEIKNSFDNRFGKIDIKEILHEKTIDSIEETKGKNIDIKDNDKLPVIVNSEISLFGKIINKLKKFFHKN